MTSFDIDAALAAANPLTAQAAAALPLNDAEAHLLQGILATPARPRRAPRSRPRRVIRLGRRRLGLVLAATAVVAAVLALLPSGERPGGPQPAFAAVLVRFANASPLVLLKLPGWHVTYVYQQPGGYGEMHFVRGPADSNGNPKDASDKPRGAAHAKPQPASAQSWGSVADRVASLTWTPVTARVRSYDAAGKEHAPTGLGVVARRYIYEGGSRRAFDLSAYFVYRGRELHFRATVTSMSMYRRELRALTAVDATTWLRAMPPSVVKSAESGPVIHQMLKGIPLPPGFDAARIHGARLVQNRYDLGAAVTGTVACLWIGDWFQARHDGDHAMVRRAVAAMATSPHWPVLRWMAKQGGWSQALISYARAMPRDRIVGGTVQPLTPADVNAGLGCSQWGVGLGPESQRHVLRRIS